MDRKNLRQQLLESYPVRIELHAHTQPASGCGRVPGDQVAKNYKAAGYDAVVITNHFSRGTLIDYYQPSCKAESIEKYLADYYLAKRTGDDIGLKVFLGAEIRFEKTGGNDYLLYGMDEALIDAAFDYIDATPQEFYTRGKDPRTLFIQAHPFRDDMTQLPPEFLDGFEVFNMHPGHNPRIALAERYANEKHISLKTIGTDYHYTGYENLCAARFPALPEDSFELAEMIRSGDFIGEIGDSLIIL
ncbi:MAG: hypothetical protein IJK23_09415 [Clostridia bacterium]|nr:hypothetical protein [Clostridia bacterium]